MIWFYTRDQESLRLETRYDNDTLEYVGVVAHPDGRQDTNRFTTLEAFQEWLVMFEGELQAQHWTSGSSPQILPEGWPKKRPPR
jgi:hypothetical protein